MGKRLELTGVHLLKLSDDGITEDTNERATERQRKKKHNRSNWKRCRKKHNRSNWNLMPNRRNWNLKKRNWDLKKRRWTVT